ncbi:MAG: DsrE family protein [Candidatus Poseidoniia archaeon]|jgi:hypothetical protein|nr:DsrE family protein [Candidatus Poseidoniia archaeon]MDP6658803.1 DsrE family protein [Candidatus Poseidoniia archaeon]MDP7007146.1 DsrE family protein [Candidatus Poseidoniia archaeon]|tara:strand:+ start:4017 stop:4388 length:372 start_codon:yes stop_codon:yes gene_type:complete
MPGALYLLLSGPADAVRALELLRLAESQAGSGDHGVAVLLQGDAVAWLAGSDDDEAAGAVLADESLTEAQAALQVIGELGGAVFACSHSLAERGIVPALKVREALAPQRVSQAIARGWQVISG